MNNTPLQEVLQQHRPLLLACEAIGWLHMAGKAHPDFLRSHGGAGVSYEANRWYEQLDPAWSDRMAWLKTRKSLAWPESLVDFLEKYAEGKSDFNLVGCLQAGHAMASGIEKNIPRETSKYLGQDATHIWLATAFGHPVRNLIQDPPELLRPGGWESLLSRIGALLDELKDLGISPPPDAQCWWEWREKAIGKDGWLRRAFETTLAETRIPNNDVTLWDQSYVASALFKSAVAGIVLLENKTDAWKNLKSETRWRVLTVGFGTEHYEARAVRIGDWLGALEDIEAFFEDVRRLVEVDLAVGSLLYRDDQVLAFTFPGQRFDDEKYPKGRSLSDEAVEALGEWIGAKVDKLAENRKLETPPFCKISRSTRSFIPMASQAAEARKQLAVPVHRSWTMPETTETQGHVCPVCHMRFNGGVADNDTNPKQRPCKVCYARRKGRLDTWLLNPADTIWITELADDYDRVALLTFSFDLEPWLNSARVDSLRAQSIAVWRRFNPTVQNTDNPIDSAEPTASLVAHVESFLRNLKKVASSNRAGKLDDPVLASINEGFHHEDDIAVFYRKMVEDRAESPSSWDQTKDDPKKAALWLVHQLFRKNASPGRVYRFWRTAEAFFNKLVPVFREVAAAHPNRWRTRRLVLTPGEDSDKEWKDRETYATRWNDAPLELLYRAKTNDFLTICNLARVLLPEQRAEALQGLKWEMEGDDGVKRPLIVKSVSEAEKLGVYTPLIVLDRSPLRFRVLLPLSAAGSCVDAAVKKWEEEFARVWDRLPLQVGVVGFPRKIPFQTVIEAARNLEDSLTARIEPWIVVQSETRYGVAALTFKRPDGGSTQRIVPVTVPDGREDVFYPYVEVEDTSLRFPQDFQHPQGQVYRHVTDLQPGDGVKVAPAQVVTLFMDSTAARFAKLKVRYLEEWERMRDLWRLVERIAPSQTALQRLRSDLTRMEQQWRGPDGKWAASEELRRDTLRGRIMQNLEGVPPSAFEVIAAAAVDGLLAWAIEWHMVALKQSL